MTTRAAGLRAAGSVLRRRLWLLIRHLPFAAALSAMGDADFMRYSRQAQNCLDEAEKATRDADKEAWPEAWGRMDAYGAQGSSAAAPREQ